MTVRILLNENDVKNKLFLFRAVVCNEFCCDSLSISVRYLHVRHHSQSRGQSVSSRQKPLASENLYSSACRQKNNQVKNAVCCMTWRMEIEMRGGGRKASFVRRKEHCGHLGKDSSRQKQSIKQKQSRRQYYASTTPANSRHSK